MKIEHEANTIMDCFKNTEHYLKSYLLKKGHTYTFGVIDVLTFVTYRKMMIDEIKSINSKDKYKLSYYSKYIQVIGNDVYFIDSVKKFINKKLLSYLKIDKKKFEEFFTNMQRNLMNVLDKKVDFLKYILNQDLIEDSGVITKTIQNGTYIRFLVFLPGISFMDISSCIHITEDKHIKVTISKNKFVYERSNVAETFPFPINVKSLKKYKYENGILEFIFVKNESVTPPPPGPPGPPGPPAPPGPPGPPAPCI